MSAEENKAFIRRYSDALGKDKSLATVDEYVAEQLLKDHIAFFAAVLPHYELDFDLMLAEDDLVSAIGSVRGTHLGEFMGTAPTGKKANFPIHISYRIANGKIVEHWMLADNLTFMQQIGAIPAPAAA